MSVSEERHHMRGPARALGVIAASVAASMALVPGAQAVTEESATSTQSVTASSTAATDAPAQVETVVTVSAPEMVYGTTGELQASVETVDGDPVTSGTVAFVLNGHTRSAEVSDGVASVPVTTEDFGPGNGYPLNHGGYWFRATYSGEGYTGAEASAKLQVVRADPALDATIDPEAVSGEPVAIEGRLTAQDGNEGQPQGSLQVVVDGEGTGEPVRVDDDGGFSTEFTAPESWEPGEHTVELTLPRHGNFNAATFTLTTTVAPTTVETVVSVQGTEMVYGTTGELQASVETVDGDPVPSGTVEFLLNGRTQTAEVSDGVASVPVTTEDFGSEYGYPLNHGGYWFRATFSGEGYTGAEASAKLQVVRAPVQIDASLDQQEFEAGDQVTIEGRVSAQEGNEGQPQGSVQVVSDGTELGEIRVDDEGRFAVEFTVPEDWQPGTHTIELNFDSNANFIDTTVEVEGTVVAPDPGPGSIWDAIKDALRDLFGWLWWLLGGGR